VKSKKPVSEKGQAFVVNIEYKQIKMKKNYNNRFVKGLIERMVRGTVTFKVKRYLPDDIKEEEPVVCKVQGTLKNYEKEFGRAYNHGPKNQFLLYYDVEFCEWRTVRCINLINPAEE
jgi:hypothetical protein